jgi:DNA-binding SARP family transcriptional activator
VANVVLPRPPLEVCVFGTSEVRIDGVPVVFAPNKAKWVFMLLALASSKGRSLARSEISTALWPWANGDKYHVNRLMPQLKRALHAHADRILVPEPNSLRLDLTGVEFDLHRYRELLKEAKKQSDADGVEAERQYRPSRLLMDFPEGEITMEAERCVLRREFTDALDSIADAAEKLDNWTAVARSIALAVEDNPHPDETRTRRLMEAFIRVGQNEQVRHAFEAFRRKGGHPPNDLVQLYGDATSSSVREEPNEYKLPAVPVVRPSDDLGRELAVIVNQSQGIGRLRKFIRQNPHLLVGSDHVLANVLMTDMQFGSGAGVDFGYIEPISGRSYLHLIAFLDQTVRIFNQRDEFTAPFSRACEQLESCVYWIGRNQLLLPSVFGPRYEEIDGTSLDPGFFLPKCRLIVGRRMELNSTRRKEKLEVRRGSGASALTIRTYDGFMEETAHTVEIDPSNERKIRCLPYRTG